MEFQFFLSLFELFLFSLVCNTKSTDALPQTIFERAVGSSTRASKPRFEVVTITKIYWTFREKVIRVCFFGIHFNRSHPLPVKKPQPNSTYTFTHSQKVSTTCTKCWATMLWTTKIHYWKNCCALCPASRRFLSKKFLDESFFNIKL